MERVARFVSVVTNQIHAEYGSLKETLSAMKAHSLARQRLKAAERERKRRSNELGRQKMFLHLTSIRRAVEILASSKDKDVFIAIDMIQEFLTKIDMEETITPAHRKLPEIRRDVLLIEEELKRLGFEKHLVMRRLKGVFKL